MYTLKEINEKLRNGNFTERNVAMAILADYADAEEQGILLRLPCKKSDIYLYEPMDADVMNEMIILGYETIKDEWCIITDFGPVPFRCIGKTVFLSREAAEEALKGGEGE